MGASIMTKRLAANPNEIVQSTDDSEIKELIVSLGIAGQLTSTPEGAKRTTQSVLVLDYPSHFILLALYLGHEKPSDNGYIAVALPKSSFTETQFREFALDFLNPDDRAPLDVRGIDEQSPEN
jgi:hypothetical protein